MSGFVTDRLWLSWHDSTRSRNLADLLDVRLVVFDRFRHGFLRHVLGTAWTVQRLLRDRPRTIYLQNSFLLLFTCAVYKALRGRHATRIIVDCHNKSLKRVLPGVGESFFWFLKRWSFRHVDLIIVSNSLLVPVADALGQNVVCLRDPLPEWRDASESSTPVREGREDRPYALFVCSFEPDEPTSLMFETAAALPIELDLDVVITGDSRGVSVPKELVDEPRVLLSGFVSRRDYRSLLVNAAVVVVLTNDHDCLMCGAYEAVGANRPLVLSDTGVLRTYFGEYAALASHDRAALLAAVAEAQRKPPDDLLRAREDFVRGFDREWCSFLEAAGEERSASVLGGSEYNRVQ